MNLYFVSGLGADQRIFERLQLPQSWKIYHIKWLKPKKRESLYDYTQRLASQINISTEFSLLGLSFGGIVAIEMSKFLNPEKLILISSVSTDSDLPVKYKFVRSLGLHKLVPSFLFKKTTALTYWFFGVKKDSDRRLLKKIIEETSGDFLKWSIDKILNWKNERRPINLFHIHGEKDKLLPCDLVHADVIIQNAGHLMVYTHSKDVSEELIKHVN